MRIYHDFAEAIPEIKRDLVEMGIRVHPKTFQDKNVEGNPDFETLELQNYIYTVVNPDSSDLKPNLPWAYYEFQERVEGINGMPVNPGTAWKSREKVWIEFLDQNGQFAYTYSERLALFGQVREIIQRLLVDRDSRQLFISIWTQEDATKLGGISRVPCSIGYQLQCRKGKLNITYLQRSADFVTHFVNDIYLAVVLQKYISNTTHIEVGNFTHWIGSLHIFKKDGAGVF